MTRAPSGRFNIGNAEVSISDLARRVKATEQHVRIVYIPRSGAWAGFEDTPRRVPDLAIRALIGYTPTIDPTKSCAGDRAPAPPSTHGRAGSRCGAPSRDASGRWPSGAAGQREDGPARSSPPGVSASATCRTSSDRAPTSATRSASSARATRCTGSRASWRWGSSEDRRRVRALGVTHVRVHNYGEPFRPAARREGAVREGQGDRRGRDDQQRIAHH